MVRQLPNLERHTLNSLPSLQPLSSPQPLTPGARGIGLRLGCRTVRRNHAEGYPDNAGELLGLAGEAGVSGSRSKGPLKLNEESH
jgi:hypothetical protein